MMMVEQMFIAFVEFVSRKNWSTLLRVTLINVAEEVNFIKQQNHYLRPCNEPYHDVFSLLNILFQLTFLDMIIIYVNDNNICLGFRV